MSSVFTVSLFEIRSKARLLPNINITETNGIYTAEANLKTSGKDIYDVTATMIVKTDDDLLSEEIYIPFVARKSTQKIPLSFEVGSPLYKYMRAVLENKASETPIIITLSYTDIDSGQEYKSCGKFIYGGEKENFTHSHKELAPDLKCYLMNKIINISLAKAEPINSEDIKVTLTKGSLGRFEMNCAVNMTTHPSYEPKSFVMACINDLPDTDWRKLADIGYNLTFDYYVKGKMTVTMELKYGEGRTKVYRDRLRPSAKLQHYCLDLKSDKLNYESLADVQELCFTVFYEDTDPSSHRGDFTIKNCTLR
jgi:methyl coenzyme M reductase subunit D